MRCVGELVSKLSRRAERIRVLRWFRQVERMDEYCILFICDVKSEKGERGV